MSDSEDDDFIAQQAMMAAAKYGGMKAKGPMVSEDKKKFDSADYYKKQEQVMKAAGVDVAGEDGEEKKDDGAD
jgi:hypothetical protein